MSERAAFISAILDNPADDTARLVFADWLEEHGEAERAEFIRCQIEAAKLPEAARAKSKLGKRAEALHKKHGKEWRAALKLRHTDGIYERGFLTGLRYFSNQFLPTADALLVNEPGTLTLDLEAKHEDDTRVTLREVGTLAADRQLRAVTKISSQSGMFNEKQFARLMSSPHLTNLREIEIFGDYIGAVGVKAIADAPAAFVLEYLDLNEALDDDDGNSAAIKLLAKSPRFASLKHLGLTFNQLTDKHVRILLASKTLPRTLRIELADIDIDEATYAEALAERFTGDSN